jgi:hypothetical protein
MVSFRRGDFILLTSLFLNVLKYRKPSRLKFGPWADRESIAYEINHSLDAKSADVGKLMTAYTSISLNIPIEWLNRMGWTTVMGLYFVSQSCHVPKKIPFLSGDSKKESRKYGWDYPGRSPIHWTHLLASTYGWGVEYIRGLDLDVALGLIQEILVDAQLDREFQWSMSEIAYPYDSASKTSKYKPLPRPDYMLEKAKEIRMVMVRKDMLPVGIFVDVGGMVGKFEKEAEAQNSQS